MTSILGSQVIISPSKMILADNHISMSLICRGYLDRPFDTLVECPFQMSGQTPIFPTRSIEMSVFLCLPAPEPEFFILIVQLHSLAIEFFFYPEYRVVGSRVHGFNNVLHGALLELGELRLKTGHEGYRFVLFGDRL